MTLSNVCIPMPREQTGPAEVRQWSDHALVQRCARRDSAALREIVLRYQQKLYRFLRPLIGSHEDTEEVVLDVFLRVWQQADRFEGRASFATWLYRIASNAAYDLLRRKKGQCRTLSLLETYPAALAHSEMINAEEVALKRLEREENSRLLAQALQALRPEERLLLLLYYTEEMGYEEIREITGCSYPVLKMRLLRARRRLRVAINALTMDALKIAGKE